jgi:hypothetical protein
MGNKKSMIYASKSWSSPSAVFCIQQLKMEVEKQ